MVEEVGGEPSHKQPFQGIVLWTGTAGRASDQAGIQVLNAVLRSKRLGTLPMGMFATPHERDGPEFGRICLRPNS